MARTRATRRRMPRRSRIAAAAIPISPIPYCPTSTEDPHGRYLQQIEDLFVKESEESYSVKLEPREACASLDAPTQICTNRTDAASWNCFTCFPEEASFCSSCFNKQLHQGHYYGLSRQKAACQCGRLVEGSCLKHRPKAENMIPEQDLLQQKSYFVGLFDLLLVAFDAAFEAKKIQKTCYQSLIDFVRKQVSRLCTNNADYIQAAHRALAQELDPSLVGGKEKVNRLKLILSRGESTNCLQIFQTLCGNVQFGCELMKLWIKKEFPIYNLQVELSFFGVLSRLAQQDAISLDLEPEYLTANGLNEESETLALKYLYFKRKSMAGERIFGLVSTLCQSRSSFRKYKGKQIHLFFITNCFTYLNDHKYKFAAQQKEEPPKVSEQDNSDNEQAQEGERSSSLSNSSRNSWRMGRRGRRGGGNPIRSISPSSAKEDISNEAQNESTAKVVPFQKSKFERAERVISDSYSGFVEMILYSMLQLVEGDLSRVPEIDMILAKAGITPEDMKEFKLLCWKKWEYNSLMFLPVKWLMEERDTRLVDRFWKGLLSRRGAEQSFIYHVFTSVLKQASKVNQFTIQMRKKFCKSPEEKKVVEQQQREDFKKFLFAHKKVANHNLWRKVESGRFNAEGIGEILNNCCSFYEEEGEFLFTGTQDHYSYLHKLQFVCSEQSFGQAFMGIKDVPHFDNPETRQPLEILLSGSYLEDYLIKALKKMFTRVEKDSHATEYYKDTNMMLSNLQALILIQQLSLSPHPAADEEISKIRDDKDYRAKYEPLSDESKLKQMFGVEEKGVADKAEEERDQEERRKRLSEKMASKKSRMNAEMKKKQNNVFELMKTKSMTKPEEDESLCMTCHEAAKPNNELVFLGKINKDHTLSSCVYGENNRAAVSIQTCFHTVHTDCFQKMDRRNNVFTCPLCSKQQNCIIPTKFSTKKNKTFRICSNFMIASLVTTYNTLDLESPFLLFFKSLVESYSMGSLVGMNREIRRSKQKVNRFFIELLSSIYETSSNSEKEDYLSEIDDFIKYIQQCPQEEAREVQALVADSLKHKILGKQPLIDLSKISKIQQILRSQEFLVIRDQLEEITDEPIEVAQLDATNDASKKSLAFSPVSLPRSAKDLAGFGKPTCDHCPEQTRLICLICGVNLCEMCEKSKSHSSEHRKRVLNFIKYEAELRLESVNSRERHCVYENEFRIEWPGEVSAVFRNTNFFLREGQVEQMLAKFYDDEM